MTRNLYHVMTLHNFLKRIILSLKEIIITLKSVHMAEQLNEMRNYYFNYGKKMPAHIFPCFAVAP